MEDNLEHFKQMGIPLDKAKEALQKFNNDLSKAVNFYFETNSGNSEEMSNLGPLISDENVTDNWAVTIHNTGSTDYQNSSAIDLTENNDYIEAIEASKKDADNDDLKRAVNASLQTMPINNNDKDDEDPQLQRTIEESYNSNFYSNLFTDPEQPTKRMKLDNNTPIGLRPANTYHCANSLIQALFYIPIFRLALLAFRPTRDDWGEVDGYWKGTQDGLQIEPEYPENDRQSALKFIHEFQKLFGFLSLSQRSYGDSSRLLDALKFEGGNNGWGDVDEYDFILQLLTSLQKGSIYRNQYDENEKQRIPDVTFNIYLLEITPKHNTIYAALDQKTRTSPETTLELAPIL
ncbi:10236_t:CDS:10, partial [Acaulospora morrowiae]